MDSIPTKADKVVLKIKAPGIGSTAVVKSFSLQFFTSEGNTKKHKFVI